MIKDNIVMGHIYVLLFPNGKRYIGQTLQSVKERMFQHISNAKRGCPFLVHKAIRKYAQENVKIEKVLTLKCTQSYLDFIEDRAIIVFNTLAPNGYNLKRGGSYGVHNEETKAKMVIARARRDPVSEDTKAKMSISHKGKRLSQESIAKRSLSHRGKHRSEETKAKMSAARRGKPSPMKGRRHSEETKAKMSANNKRYWKGKTKLKGRRLSEQTKMKISLALKGRRLSEETKAKVSAARKAYWVLKNLGQTSKMKG